MGARPVAKRNFESAKKPRLAAKRKNRIHELEAEIARLQTREQESR